MAGPVGVDERSSAPPAQPGRSAPARASADLGVPEDLLYRALLETFPDVTVFAFGPDLRYRLVGGEAFTRLGWTRAELVGRKPTEVLPVAEGLELERQMTAALAGEVGQYEHAGIRDRSVEWLSTVAPVRGPDGAVVAGIIVSRDVAAIRRAERARLEMQEAHRRAAAEAAMIRAASEQLQHGLLPPAPPAVPSLEIAATYRPASDTAEVGGDWFDAVEVPDRAGRRTVDLVVGDVQGHDGEAAALMARLASVVRADSQRAHELVDIVADMHRFHDSLAVERLVTVAIARVHTGDGSVQLVNAGHPPPLVLRADGESGLVAVDPAPPVGTGDLFPAVQPFQLAPSDALVLFSDGLLDPRAGPDEALARIARAARGCVGAPVGDIVQALAATSSGYEPSDDVVVVAARWAPTG